MNNTEVLQKKCSKHSAESLLFRHIYLIHIIYLSQCWFNEFPFLNHSAILFVCSFGEIHIFQLDAIRIHFIDAFSIFCLWAHSVCVHIYLVMYIKHGKQ